MPMTRIKQDIEDKPIISIITVAFGAAKTIRNSLESVAGQTYANIEHIIVDGKSTDKTIEIIKSFPHVAHSISEPDRGMYDALNKGIAMATGDYIGTLNADDVLHNPEVIQNLVDEIEKDQKDVYFGDVRFVRKNDNLKTLRYYSSAKWRPEKFGKGYMPAHPSCYIRREMFEKFGNYKIDYHIAADYELLIRYLYTNGASYRYISRLMVDMLPGGRSNQNLRSRYILNKEIVRACCENGINTNMFKLSLKYFRKVFEFLPNKR